MNPETTPPFATSASPDIARLEQELREQRQIVEKIYVSAEKTRKYFLWTMWATIIVFVVPLIVLAFVIPPFLNSYLGSIDASSLGL